MTRPSWTTVLLALAACSGAAGSGLSLVNYPHALANDEDYSDLQDAQEEELYRCLRQPACDPDRLRQAHDIELGREDHGYLAGAMMMSAVFLALWVLGIYWSFESYRDDIDTEQQRRKDGNTWHG